MSKKQNNNNTPSTTEEERNLYDRLCRFEQFRIENGKLRITADTSQMSDARKATVDMFNSLDVQILEGNRLTFKGAAYPIPLNASTMKGMPVPIIEYDAEGQLAKVDHTEPEEEIKVVSVATFIDLPDKDHQIKRITICPNTLWLSISPNMKKYPDYVPYNQRRRQNQNNQRTDSFQSVGSEEA